MSQPRKRPKGMTLTAVFERQDNGRVVCYVPHPTSNRFVVATTSRRTIRAGEVWKVHLRISPRASNPTVFVIRQIGFGFRCAIPERPARRAGLHVYRQGVTQNTANGTLQWCIVYADTPGLAARLFFTTLNDKFVQDLLLKFRPEPNIITNTLIHDNVAQTIKQRKPDTYVYPYNRHL